jgi:hypothetical protein
MIKNDQGSITHFAQLELTVDEYTGWTDFLVCGLGGEDIILSFPWLREVNPLIDWRKGTLYAPCSQVVCCREERGTISERERIRLEVDRQR